MPTPEQLRKLSKIGKAEKAKKETIESVARKLKQAELEAEKAEKAKKKAEQAILNAEYNMELAANDGLNAALVYHIESDDVVEHEHHSLGTGSKVNSSYKNETHSCRGASKIVFDYFKDKGFEVVIVSQPGPYDPEGPTSKEYYVKVGW